MICFVIFCFMNMIKSIFFLVFTRKFGKYQSRLLEHGQFVLTFSHTEMIRLGVPFGSFQN